MNKRQKSIKDIVLIAMLTATLTGGKFALAFLPNIEIVTLLIITYAYVFNLKTSLTATLIFVVLEGFLYGFNTWLIVYIVYWPLLSFATYLLTKLIKPNFQANEIKNTSNQKFVIKLISFTALAVLFTTLFGVLSSFIDALIGSGKTNNTLQYLFPIIYLRGIGFYLTQIISNAIIISICFIPLSNLLTNLNNSYYNLDTHKEY